MLYGQSCGTEKKKLWPCPPWTHRTTEFKAKRGNGWSQPNVLRVIVIIADIYAVRPGIKIFSQDITYISSFEPRPCYHYFTDEVMKAQRGWWFAQGQHSWWVWLLGLGAIIYTCIHFPAAVSQAWCWRHMQGMKEAGKSLTVLSVVLSNQESHWALQENMPIIVLWHSPSPAPNFLSYRLEQMLAAPS